MANVEREIFVTNRKRPGLWKPAHEEIIAKLGKYPKIIEETEFNEKGLAVTKYGLLVPVYVGSGLGFSEEGTSELNKKLYPAMIKRGMLPLCPFKACAEFLPPEVFDVKRSVEENYNKWKQFNEIIGMVNYGILMRYAHFMYANLNGYPPDEGVAAEVAYFASNYGEVIGSRTDFRLAENPAVHVNPAVTFFIGGVYGGKLIEVPSKQKDTLREAKKMARLKLAA